MSELRMTTSMLEVELNPENPLRIERIVHRPSGRVVLADGEQRFLVRYPNRLSDPVFPTELKSVDVANGSTRFRLVDEDESLQLEGEMSETAHGLRWSIALETPEPAWMLEWRIAPLDVDRVLVPALGGQMLARDMPADTQVTYKYPFWWNAQFGIGAFEDDGGVWLRTMDVKPLLKLLRVHKIQEKNDLFGFGLGFEADAPLEALRLESTWYLDGYEGEWRRPVDVHRSWLEEVFDLVPYRSHPHYPEWADSINFILEIWGMTKERPEPLHTFDDMIERIREFARHHAPSKTLLYLPGFAEEGIDSNAPDYDPAPKLGGREAFRRLIDEAHRLGYRVMIHTNVLALAYSHRLFDRLSRHQVRDVFGRKQGWGNDIDGDWLAEPFFAYVNPGAEEWGDHMSTVLGKLIEEFGLDAVFLDQTLLAFNVSNGPNFVEGMRSHVERLQRAFPQVLFAGEGLHEQVLPALPMAQIHGIDSIAGIHGLEGAREWRHVHPISSYLFSPFTRLTAHLLTKHPSSSVFERQEAAYRDLGVVPALVLYRKSQKIDVPELQEMVRRAESLSSERNINSEVATQ